ncbi:MAG: RHS repeat-associated core domain-containing protein, partial [Anaerolineae bacterium]
LGESESGSLQDTYDVKYHQVSVAAGEHLFVILDAATNWHSYDLYIRFGALPTTTDYDVKGDLPRADQAVEIADTQEGTYYIMVRSTSGGGDYTIVAHDHTTFSTLTLGESESGSLQDTYDVKYHQVSVAAGEHLFVILHAVADWHSYDLYIRFGALPTPTDYDVKGDWPGADQTARIADTQEGTYYILVRSTSGGGDYTIVAKAMAVEVLEAGVDHASDYGAGWVEHYYRMPAAGSSNLLLELESPDPGLHFCVSYGSLPSPGVYDYHSVGDRLVIPAAADGNWYILVYGHMTQAGTYTLRYDMRDLILARISPSRRGTGRDLELTLTGAGFFQPLNVALESDVAVYEAPQVEVDSYEQAVATFPAGVLPTGIYTVRVSRGGESAELPDALEIIDSGDPNLEVDLILPARFGYHSLATVYVEYANTGDDAMLAPLLLVTATQNEQQGAILTLDQSLVSSGLWSSAMPEGFANSVQFLASGETPGILQSGESHRRPVYYAGWQRPWDFDYPPLEWSVGVLEADDTTPVDWAAQKDEMRPNYVREDAWDFVWDNFTALAGNTWGEYVAMLSGNASYLHGQGHRVEDISSLLAFTFRQAEGLSPIRELTGDIDAAVQAPGLPVVFDRSYLQPISRRFELGPLGRGWTHNWQITLKTREDDTVVITDRTGTPRIFQPDSRYPGRYLAQPGDEGELRSVDGEYRLTELDGTIQSFSSDGHLDYMEDTNGNRITCTYDGDLLTGLVHSAGPALTIDYDGGRIASITDHHGRQTQYAYSGEHLTAVEFYDGRTTTYSYDTSSEASQHALSEIGLPDGTTRIYTYEEHGWLSAAYRDDEEERVNFTYAGNGQVNMTNALGDTSLFFFDHWGRLVKAENALGEAVRMSFDEVGNLIAVTDPDGFSTNFAYDRRGNLIEVTDALRHTTHLAYTQDFNRLAAVTDALGNCTDYGHDDQGNLISITYPDGSMESWGYDPQGNPTTWSNRRGNAIAYRYDAEGRITRKTYADARQANYTYDERGNLVEAQDANGSTAFAYDEHDYLVRIDYPADRWLAFSYDEAGRRASSLDQTGRRLDYHHDAAGRLERITDETNSQLVRYAYDVVGRLARKTVGNGVYTDYSYDAAGRLSSLVNRAPDHTQISRFDYAYDRRGRRTEMATHYGTWSYQYDNLGQLTRAELESTDPDILDQELIYEYDALGNRIRTVVNGEEEAYSVNHLNQYTQVGDRTYTYDADGNLIEESGPDGVTIYTYDDENRLIGVSRGGDAWEYTYDALGNRVAVDENGAVTHYVIDPIGLGNVVSEYDDAGNLLAHYDHGYGLLGRIDAGEGASYYTFDALGNVSELTSAAGVVRNVYAYRPFGETLRRETTVPNPFEFVGQWGVMAEGNGLNFMRARFYEPGGGRFTAVDPIGLQGGMSLYAYCANEPVYCIDPEGLECKNPKIKGWDRVWELLFDRWMWYATQGKDIKQFVREPRQAFVETVAVETVKTLFPEDSIVSKSPYRMWREARDAEVGPLYCAPTKDPVDDPPDIPAEPFIGVDTGTAGAVDPNEKTGPAGHGAENYVAPGQSLAYRVDFENLESATAPAQIVTIRDPLSEHLDLSTFELTEIGFGDMLIAVPGGRQYYQTVVEYAYSDDEYDFDIEVHIEAWLEEGTIYVNFFSIDPETGLPPQDVSIGFLPPENETGRGQGFVSYIIRPKLGLASGTEIRNIATLQFDFSLQIDTNQVDPLDKSKGTDPDKEALVTIDSLPPASTVDPLPAVTETEHFTVSWSGQDDEHSSGVGTYDVYVRKDTGTWTLWQKGTGETSAAFVGVDGHTYSFYSIAIDNVGNRETKAAQAEASTHVDVTSECPIFLPLLLCSP